MTERQSAKDTHSLPPFERSLAATLLKAKEAIMAPLRPMLREAEVTEPQWRVMRVINDRGRTDATGLAEVGLLHAPSVTRILRELEERGLVAREADPGDKRRAMVSLTPAGQAMVKTTSRHMMRIMNAYSERFGEARLERLVDELHALSAAVDGVE